MKIFVISVSTSLERRKHIEDQFSAQGIVFEFFDAITPEPAKKIALEYGLNTLCDSLKGGELACFMSHVSIWQKIVDNNISYACVFEDDVCIGEDVNKYLSKSEWIPENINFIKIEAFSRKVLMEYKGVDLPQGDRKLFRLLGGHIATAGYIVSGKASKSLLSFVKNNRINMPIDHVMFEGFLEDGDLPIFQMNPALCMQEDILNGDKSQLPSLIEKDRLARRDVRREQTGAFARLKREFLRPFIQLWQLITLKKFLLRRVYFR